MLRRRRAQDSRDAFGYRHEQAQVTCCGLVPDNHVVDLIINFDLQLIEIPFALEDPRKIAWSVESMGGWRLGEIAKCMI